MNMNRSWTPPDNSKILPNMYNVLDAHAMKKTSNINGMLNYQLTTQQNVISRHKCLAERIHREEKARVTNALNQIHGKLPAVERIRDFNIKFFKNKSLEDYSTTKKSRGFSYSKSDDPICRRCYKHHFAIKKNKLLNNPFINPPSIPRNRPLPPLNTVTDKNKKSTEHEENDNETSNEIQVDPNPTDNFFLPETELAKFLSLDKEELEEHDVVGSRGTAPPTSPTKQAFGWWMPNSKTYQFLKKDPSGREIDVNKHYTPRLMPYEDWKNIVKDVCSHCSRPDECAATRQPPGPVHSIHKTHIGL